ncbi:MAG: sigma 54-interacting transcriptional regulator [Clostridium sp.]
MYCFDDILGISEEINKVKAIGIMACQTSSPVFIYGETGTGKEMMAQAIHCKSGRCKKPFVAQNCSAIPENLLESIFFGVSKGSFTGAAEAEGLFEVAEGGTLYLDELNSMDISFQGKLLRVIQEGELRRLGENKIRKVDVRIITSVSEEPELLLKTSRLRKDLYYRLNVIRIDIPSLDERKEDIPFLINSFISKHNLKLQANIEGITEEALKAIMKKTYAGNVRELEHLIEGAIILKHRGVIDRGDLNLKENLNTSLKCKLEIMEKKYIKEALIICDYNVSKASVFLDIPRQTLQYKIKKYEIEL